ncbi:hypothetical protein [Pontimicrobium sp. MEBiC06410]
MNYKVKFPGGYNIKSVFNDNIDVHFILENGSVFFCNTIYSPEYSNINE